MTELSLHEIAESEIGPFFDLIGEIECGEHFDPARPDHIDWLKETIHRRCGSGIRFYGLVADDGTSVGIVGVRIDRFLDYPNPKAEMTHVGIFPQYRDKGYGSKLLGLVEDLARQAGVYCLYMLTYASDYKVISFYGKNGYAPVATLPDVNGPEAEGDVYMRKILG